ncbi:MAG TPA: carbohydrate kinase [Terriglobales bacterium]
MHTVATVVGLGEILWDLLPSGRQLGGAPANFAYASHLLGDRAIVASRVGGDELGQEIRTRLLGCGMTDEFLQSDLDHPTGTVGVEVNEEGQPRFEIHYPAAWDFLEWSEEWRALTQFTDAVCFGSLAQRSAESRASIRAFLQALRPQAVRIFDVNLRQSFYSTEILAESVALANVVKLSHEEVPRVAELLAIPGTDDLHFARGMMANFRVALVCITRGARGSLLASASAVHDHPGFRVTVKDTIGAGDAFTAGLVHAYLRDQSLADMNDLANQMGAWVASTSGGMPVAPESGLREALRELKRD